jgi:hypothetical protein
VPLVMDEKASRWLVQQVFCRLPALPGRRSHELRGTIPVANPMVTGQTYHVKLHIWDKVTAGNEINAETRPGGRIIVFIKYQSTKIITMPVIFMPAKSAAILLLVLGTICLVDGIIKKDTKEILVALATLAYSVYKLVTARKKKQDNKSAGSTIGKPRQ